MGALGSLEVWLLVVEGPLMPAGQLGPLAVLEVMTKMPIK